MKNYPEVKEVTEGVSETCPNEIRNHLSSHLESNPNSSYVTWIATLHPESAEVVIDERFLVPNNPWWTVFEEAKAIPTVTAVQVETTNDNLSDTESHGTHARNNDTGAGKRSCFFCSPIGWILGMILSMGAVLVVFAIELAAFLLYQLSSLFFHLAEIMRKGPLVFTGFFFGIFTALHHVFGSLDAFLLGVSVALSELLGFLCHGLCCLLCCSSQGGLWRHHIRRTCHLLRWAFRNKPTHPPRHGFGSLFDQEPRAAGGASGYIVQDKPQQQKSDPDKGSALAARRR